MCVWVHFHDCSLANMGEKKRVAPYSRPLTHSRRLCVDRGGGTLAARSTVDSDRNRSNDRHR